MVTCVGECMTAGKLISLINKYHIPEDVQILADTEWECGEVFIGDFIWVPARNQLIGVVYSKEELLEQKSRLRPDSESYLNEEWIWLK